MRSRRPVVISALVLMLVFGIMLVPTGRELFAQDGPPSAPSVLQSMLERIRQVRGYHYAGDVEQRLLPRPVPGMIGEHDQVMTLAIDGELQGANHSRTTLRFDPGNVTGVPNVAPVTITRDGDQVYAERDGKRTSFDNDPLVGSPTDNTLDYLQAAENARWLDPQAVNGTTYRRIEFDLHGKTLARALQTRLNATRPGASADVSSAYAQSTGSGVLWIDADGLPVREEINLDLPDVSTDYQARLLMRVSFDRWVVYRRQALRSCRRCADGPHRSATTSAWSKPSSLAAPICCWHAWFCCWMYILWYRRDRTRAQAATAITLTAIIVCSPGLQAGATVHAQAQAQKAPSLGSLLGVPGAAKTVGGDTGAAQVSPQVQQDAATTAGLIQRCGDGDPTKDTDGDTINDRDEGCLGTNPYNDDSDADVIPDQVEITPFTVGNRQWSLNPTKTDSNDDGLNDFLEMPPTQVTTTINNVPRTVTVGAAPVRAGGNRYDWDGDGVPNVWDDDNDGDGIPDATDLSPFAIGTYQREFRIRSQGAGYTGTEYFEFQVQPQNPAHLRYGLTVFDWPLDDKGAMQNYSGHADVHLQPFLEVVVNKEALPRTYAKDYGVVIRDDAPAVGYQTLYLPLQPVGAGGAVSAFYGKVAFAASELAKIDWRAQLVWFVQGETQDDKGGSNSLLLNVYRQENVRVAGLKVTKSGKAENFMLAAPDSPTEDQYLMGAAVGMNMFYLGASTVPTPTAGLSPLHETANRFNSTNIAKELRFNIPTTVNMAAAWSEQPHGDAAIKDLGTRVNDFLNAHVASYFTNHTSRCDDGDQSNLRCASMVVALDEHDGSLSQDDLTSNVGTNRHG